MNTACRKKEPHHLPKTLVIQSYEMVFPAEEDQVARIRGVDQMNTDPPARARVTKKSKQRSVVDELDSDSRSVVHWPWVCRIHNAGAEGGQFTHTGQAVIYEIQGPEAPARSPIIILHFQWCHPFRYTKSISDIK